VRELQNVIERAVVLCEAICSSSTHRGCRSGELGASRAGGKVTTLSAGERALIEVRSGAMVDLRPVGRGGEARIPRQTSRRRCEL